MKPTLPIQLPQPVQDAIASRIPEFCQRWKIAEFYFFGSVLRDDFRPDSDIDVMVQFEADVAWGLLEFVRMKRELETLLGWFVSKSI